MFLTVFLLLILLTSACGEEKNKTVKDNQKSEAKSEIIVNTKPVTKIPEIKPEKNKEPSFPNHFTKIDDPPDSPITPPDNNPNTQNNTPDIVPEEPMTDELTPAVLSSQCDLSLNRLLLTKEIKDREPLTVSTTFPADGNPVFVFMDINNAKGPKQDMEINWTHPQSNHSYTQTIPAGVSPRWRTWVKHRIPKKKKGTWKIKVFTQDCKVGEIDFKAQ